MKWLLALLGLLAGIVAGVAIIIFNPRMPAWVVASGNSTPLHWSTIDFHGRVHSAFSMFTRNGGQESSVFGSSRLRNANAAIMILRNEAGAPLALATRIQHRARKPDLLAGDLGVQTYTNIFLPNYGSALIHGYENRFPLLKSEVQALIDSAAQPEQSWLVSSQGSDKQQAGIVGGSGQLDAASGFYSETIERSADAAGYTGTISIAFD